MLTYYLCFSYFSPSYCVNLIPFSHSTTWPLQFFQTLCSKCLVNTSYGQAVMLWCYDRCTFSYYVFYFVLYFTSWNRNERRQDFHVLFHSFVLFCFLAETLLSSPSYWMSKAINTLSNWKYFLQKEKYYRLKVKYKILLLGYKYG